MISSVHIQNFKALLNHTISFKALTVLAGANSVGKSSVIQCLLLAKISEDTTVNSTQIPLNGEYLLSLGSAKKIISDDAENEEIKISIVKDNDSFQYIYNLPPQNERFLILQERNSIQNERIRMGVFEFTQLQYLNAERIGPRVRHEMKNYDLNVGFQGEYAIDVLAKYGGIHRLDEHKCFPNDAENNKLSYQVQKWMNFVLPGVEINANVHDDVDVAEMSVNHRTPPNVGFGISYVLPIIVAGLIAEEDSILIVENPEAHLHPSGQSKMGQFLAKMAGAGIQIVVETHSEHIINGMRLASLYDYIPHNEVIINFFHQNLPSKELKIQAISLNESVDLSKWPPHFFDQTQRDFAEMMRIKQSRRNGS